MFQKIAVSAIAAALALSACSDEITVTDEIVCIPAKKTASLSARTQSEMVPELETQRGLDIVIRDFDVTHPDFENFQEEAWNSMNNGNHDISVVGDEYAVTAERWT